MTNTEMTAGQIADAHRECEIAFFRSRITFHMWRVLNFLAHEPGPTLSEIAEHLKITPSSASNMCGKLASAGLIVIGPHPTLSGIHRSVNLTEAGNNAHTDGLNRLAAALADC